MVEGEESDKRRLVKNTLALYARTAIAMVVGLVVTRVLLRQLGEDAYGVYNVVAGLVVLFSFLNAGITQAIQRFLTFSLGKGERADVTRVFSTSIITQFIIIVLLVALCETLGLWFIDTQMKIGASILEPARWAFQLSIATFAVNFMRVSYESAIIAYERMAFFAYAAIADSLLKLGIVYMLAVSPADRLVFYCALLLAESVVMLIAYRWYCRSRFDTCRFIGGWNGQLFREMLCFSGWNVLGSISNIISQKGIVFLLNVFVGLVANAAMGIANQVNAAVTQFINSFQTSFRPQIVKAYARGDHEYMRSLVFSTSKISFLLVCVPALIIIVNAPVILSVWLTEVPDYTVSFCRLITVCCVIDAVSGPYNCAILATGNIRAYQIALTISALVELMLYYILLRAGVSASYLLYARIFSRGILNMGIGLFFMHALLDFPVRSYLIKVIGRIAVFLGLVLPSLCYMSVHLEGGKLFMWTLPYICVAVVAVAVYVVLSPGERIRLRSMILRR